MKSQCATILSRYGPLWAIAFAAWTASPAAPAFGQQRDPAPADAKKPEDLSERLIRKSVTGSDEDVMDRIVRFMDASARRLEIEFDAGEETQAVQQRIAKELDDAIKLAASRMRKNMRNDPDQSGDQRRHRQDPGSTDQRDGNAGKNADNASPDATTESAGADAPGSDRDTPFRESRRGWGHLPRRQRDEVLQGIGEQSLERYRDWIERYYRALQESEE